MCALEMATNIDRDEWGRFVSDHPRGSVFQTPEMYDVYAAAEYHEPMILGALEDGKLKGVLLSVLSRYGGRVRSAFSSRSTVYGGPLVANDDQKISTLLIASHDSHVQGRALFSQARNIHDPEPVLAPYRSCGYTYNDHLNYLVDLSRGEDAVFSRFQSKKRQVIRRSIREGMTTRVGDKADLGVFYQMLMEIFHQKARLPLPRISFFESIFEILVPRNLAQLFICEKESVPMAGTLCLTYRDTIHSFYNGSFREHLRHYPNDSLHWEIMRWGILHGYSLFDFGGGGAPHEKFGVRDFKKQFGGREVNFGWFTKVFSPVRLALARIAFEAQRRLAS